MFYMVFVVFCFLMFFSSDYCRALEGKDVRRTCSMRSNSSGMRSLLFPEEKVNENSMKFSTSPFILTASVIPEN